MEDNKIQNLYEVRKTVRFSMLKQNYDNFNKIDKNIIKDVSFLNQLLNFEENISSSIKTRLDGKKLQDLINYNILESWLTEAFQIIKNQICSIIYNSIVYNIKPSSQYQAYIDRLKTETHKSINFFIPKGYLKEKYIPEEDFYKVKDSEIWYSIKLISNLIIDNHILDFSETELINTLKNITKFNPNFDNFFDLETLNPYTVNRWKISEIDNKYKLTLEEYRKEFGKLNEKGKSIIKLILDNNIFKNFHNKKEKNNVLVYLGHILGECKKNFENNYMGVNHMVLLINKYDSLKNGNIKFKNEDIDKKIKDFSKNLKQLNKINSELLGYKIHLLDNFQTEKYSFLIKSGDYYFIGNKKSENLTNYLNFLNNLPKGKDELIYIDSMTWGGFKKLFLSYKSDLEFEDKTNIKDLNKEILEVEENILNEKEKNKIEINDFKSYILDSNNKDKDEELKFIQEKLFKFPKLDSKENLLYDNDGNIILKTKISDIKRCLINKQKYFNNFYYEDLKNYIISKSNLESLKKQYLDLVIELLNQIKDKKYKVGAEFKDLSFLGEIPNFENLEDFENYFNNLGYAIKVLKIDFESIFQKLDEFYIEIFQIKSKDMPFYKEFINEKNCGITSNAKITKSKNYKKDLNTIYFESFFNDIKNGNSYARLGADFKIRGINATSKNNYENFWKKEKNISRHLKNKDSIENFQNRFKRDRYSIEFFMNLNATNHLDEQSFNNNVLKKLKQKFTTGENIKILSIDHGESSFLTYKIYEIQDGDFSTIKLIENGGNFDNFQEIPKKGNSKGKKQDVIQIDESQSYEEQKVIENYITKYHKIIQTQKRERQIQEALKSFSIKSILVLKAIISSDKLDKSKPGVTDETLETVRKTILEFLSNKKIKNNKKNKENYKFSNSIYSYLLKNYFEYDKYNFIKGVPDEVDFKEKIDNYINGIEKLLNSDDELKDFCDDIKLAFDGVSKSDFEKLKDTPFFNFKNDFQINLNQINNLKKGYSSVLIGYISKLLIDGKIDAVCVESNLLSYGVDNSKVSQKYMGTENQSTFIQALINKLSFCLNKETLENYQFCYPVKASNTNKYRGKNNGVIMFIDEKDTSLICPKCGNKLYGHGKGETWEHNMHHCDNPKDCPSIEYHISKENKSNCDYHMKNNPYGFSFITSGDDLATYNIAKKGLEYIKNSSISTPN